MNIFHNGYPNLHCDGCVRNPDIDCKMKLNEEGHACQMDILFRLVKDLEF